MSEATPKPGMHLHCCGFDPSMRPGCGRVWRHSDTLARRLPTYNAFLDAHKCPSCGRGPWGYQYKPAFAPMIVRLDENQADAIARANAFAEQHVWGFAQGKETHAS